MPIKDKSKYPPDWKAISKRIRERDGQRCKWCGVANYAVGARDRFGEWHDEDSIHCMNSGCGIHLFGEDFPKIIKIVLTVAHIDHDTANNADDNLAALCQKCHLTHDAKFHVANARGTRIEKKRAAIRATGQGELFAAPSAASPRSREGA